MNQHTYVSLDYLNSLNSYAVIELIYTNFFLHLLPQIYREFLLHIPLYRYVSGTSITS